MPAGYKRVRTQSANEERNVQSFIDSCVNFKSNVTFHSLQDAKKLLQEESQQEPNAPRRTAILLLGSATALKDTPSVEKVFPYASSLKSLPALISSAPEGKAYVASIMEAGGTRILIGKIPDTASRHNCPIRPDVINKIIKSAMLQAPSEGGLDIYVVGGSPYELAIATAIARSCNRSFSAKGGKAESGYLKQGSPVRVVLEKDTAAALSIGVTSVQLCQRLVDAPTNLLDTTTFTEIVVSIVEGLAAKGICVSASIIKGEELREQGYGGLYGTGKAAEFPPHLVTLSYKPKESVDPTDRIAFVGKGIVYDTGGLAIKSREGMCSMKHDMGGAAAVFCGFVALAKLNVPLEISCVLCLADNAVGPRAQRNDDILRLKSGVTIEINNTDAEGRLVLSDGVYHASAELPYKPSIIVDMATLTGAQGIATGTYHAAIYATTEESEQRFMKAGRRSGDLCFPVVYCPELHNEELTSVVADYRNSVANRSNAQVSCAAQFIMNNVAKGYEGHNVHVDLARPATYNQGTGFGVALLLEAFAPECF